MKNFLKQISDLYRIETLIIRNHKIYYKSKGEIFMERLVQIVFTVGLIGIMSVVVRLIFNL